MIPVPWHSFDGERVERFISVMLLREFPDGSRRRPVQGDGGIDVIVPVSDNPTVYDVYQIKKFFKKLEPDQRRKISASASRLMETAVEKRMTIRKWHLTLPLDGSSDEEEWLRSLLPPEIVTRWKGFSYLEGLCAKYRDVVDYYVLGGQERLNDLVRHALSLNSIQPSAGDSGMDVGSLFGTFRPIFDQLNSSDPHYYYNIAMLHRDDISDLTTTPSTAVMSQFLGEENGPTLRVDVYPRYRQAVEDRPIAGTIRITVPKENRTNGLSELRPCRSGDMSESANLVSG